MYSIDEKDEVLLLNDVPQPDRGAPCPLVLSNDLDTVVAYYIRHVTDLREDHCALVKFHRTRGVLFGLPNDEAFEGHPLASRGLEPYGTYLVKNSSWIRQLEQRNAVHPYHDPKQLAELSHYIFAFHDNTFECVAQNISVKELPPPRNFLLDEMSIFLNER